MFILSLAFYVMVICMVIKIFAKNEKLNETYFNIDENVSKPVRLTGYVAMAYIGTWLLSLIVFPVAIVLPILQLAVWGLSWWWLVSTVQNGNVAVWFADAKAYFNK